MTDTLTGHDVEEGELPSGWAVSRLGDLAGLGPKVPAELLEANDDLSFVPMAAVTEVSGEVDLTQTITAQEGKKRSLKYFADGDVIFAKITPCMENGKVARPSGLTNGAAFGSTEFHVLRPTPAIDGDFLRLFLVHDDFRYEAERAMTGAVGQRRVPKKYLEDFPLPTPPLEEQERIVEILEDQLGRLDTALESVQAVREKAAQFRRSLLHAAFTGALTGQAVEEGELPHGWDLVTLGDVCTKPQYGWTTSAAEEGSIKLLRTTDLTHGPVDWATVPFCEETPSDLRKYLVESGDILISRAGSVGVSVLVDSIEEESVFASYLIRVRCLAVIRPKCLKLFLESPAYWSQISDMSAGTALANVNATKLKALELPLPSLEEQERIVEILEDQLSRLDASLTVADAVEERSAALRRSLLHSAFTGRLTEEWREAVNV